ncbi:hypothetical protein WQQ_07620 [Hydrocarboniphaga effusa AP103]|jgi:hypothetical protein|uniref:Uncharacterized protein n=1 Tax=Hydrocarboniphaga effusa AP103 TaxID=1172194 RepID=I8TAA9_9GAMM|nr:hypothetical protein WQQ_07620 [Hydrocarboniphaga effusa AP103]
MKDTLVRVPAAESRSVGKSSPTCQADHLARLELQAEI